MRLERLQREEYIESLGIEDYNASFEAVTGYRSTRWQRAVSDFCAIPSRCGMTRSSALKKSLGIKASQAKRADALALFRASEYDDAFPATR